MMMSGDVRMLFSEAVTQLSTDEMCLQLNALKCTKMIFGPECMRLVKKSTQTAACLYVCLYEADLSLC